MTGRLVAAAAVAGLWASVAFAGAPNLQVTAVSCPPNVGAGQTIIVDNTVAETRDQDASTTFTVGIYLSDNARIDPAVDTWLGQRVVSGGLGPLGSSADSTTVTIPLSAVPGDYFIGAYADIDDVVPENNPNDNDDSVPVVVLGLGGWSEYYALVAPGNIAPLGGGCSPGGGGGPGPAAWLPPILMLAGVLVVSREASKRVPRGASRRVPGGRDASRARPAAAGLLVLLALFAVMTAGCGGILLGADGTVPIAPRSTADGSPDVAHLGSRLPAAMPSDARQAPVAVRLGLLTTAGEDTKEYDASLMPGVYYPGKLWGLFGLDAIPFEAGVDFALWVDSDDSGVESTLILWRFDCLFSKWPAAQSDADLYFLGGYTFVHSKWEVGSIEDDEHASGLDVGVGLSWAEIGLDARFTWTKLLGSDNIGSLFLFTTGYRF